MSGRRIEALGVSLSTGSGTRPTGHRGADGVGSSEAGTRIQETLRAIAAAGASVESQASASDLLCGQAE